MYKRLSFLCLCVCLNTTLFANMVSLYLDYDVYLCSYYSVHGNDYSKINEAENSNVSVFLNKYGTYYNGGSDFQYNASNQCYQLAEIFFQRNYNGYQIKNWTYNYVIGTLTIGTNSDFPIGSMVPVQIHYLGATIDSFSIPEYQNKGLGIYTDYYSNTIYEISGDQELYYTLNLTAGKQYDIYVYLDAGSYYNPITKGSATGVLFNFISIPEPATIIILPSLLLFIKKDFHK